MSFNSTIYSFEHLLGKVSLPRYISALVRSAKRRNDPDGGSSQPYYAGVAGRILTVTYTNASLVIVTEDITIGANSYPSIIAQINAIDSANLGAVDLDGFLGLKNLNAGGAHFIKIEPQVDPADEAAGLLGFDTDPLPGSVSYSGELASAPGTRSQKNPHGTALLGKDEDLTSESLNRALASVLAFAQAQKIELDREVLVTEKVTVTLANNTTTATVDGLSGGQETSAGNVFTINDPTLRIPVHLFTGADPGAAALEEVFRFLRNGSEVVFDTNSAGARFRVRSVHYSTAPTTPNFRDAALTGNTFTLWATPDNRSIFGSAVGLIQKTKHATVAISEVRGNIVKCSGATFVTRFVQPGDTVRITGATNDSPFSHNGEFIVETVYGEEVLGLRPKAVTDPLVFSTDQRPTELNQSTTGSPGSITVPIGHHLPASNLVFVLERTGGTGWALTTATSGTFELLLKVGKPLRAAASRKLARDFAVSPDNTLAYIQSHIDDTSAAHDAPDIAWTAAQPTWSPTAETIAGANLQALLQNLIAMLGDSETVTTAETGAGRIGSGALTGTAPDNAPRSLTAGSVRTQLRQLLEFLNNHMNDAIAHAGAGALYSGSPNWFDSTNIAVGVTIDQALDEIVNALGGAGGADGAGKIRTGARSTWLGARTNPAGVSVTAALSKIIDDLGAATTNDDGAERVGAAAGGTGNVLTAGSVRSQLSQLADQWGRLSRAQTWTALQTLNGAAGDTSGVVNTTSVPVARKLLWEVFLLGSTRGRLYAGAGALGPGWEFVVNAVWNGTVWDADDDAQASFRVVVLPTGLLIGERAAGAGTWSDASGWTSNVRLKASGSTSDYTMTLPTALPASTSLLQWSSAGVVSSTRTPFVDDLNHTTKVLHLSAAAALATSTGSAGFDADVGAWFLGNGEMLTWSLPLCAGDRVLFVTLIGNFTAAGTRTMALRQTDSSGSDNAIASTTNNITGIGAKVFDLVNSVLDTNGVYRLKFTAAASTLDVVYGLMVSWDRPP